MKTANSEKCDLGGRDWVQPPMVNDFINHTHIKKPPETPWRKGFGGFPGWRRWEGRVPRKGMEALTPPPIPMHLFHLASPEFYYCFSNIPVQLTDRSYSVYLWGRGQISTKGVRSIRSSLCFKDEWPRSHKVEFSFPLATVNIFQWAKLSSPWDFCPSKETSIKVICKVQTQESITILLINQSSNL